MGQHQRGDVGQGTRGDQRNRPSRFHDHLAHELDGVDGLGLDRGLAEGRAVQSGLAVDVRADVQPAVSMMAMASSWPGSQSSSTGTAIHHILP
jgi:hypothetical protein